MLGRERNAGRDCRRRFRLRGQSVKTVVQMIAVVRPRGSRVEGATTFACFYASDVTAAPRESVRVRLRLQALSARVSSASLGQGGDHRGLGHLTAIVSTTAIDTFTYSAVADGVPVHDLIRERRPQTNQDRSRQPVSPARR
jgi:hypothetical protein